MERLATVQEGRVEVSGRWFGVRGRRFVRPTLTLRFGSDEPERRWLADLDHKPWAAADGELWMAAFPVDAALESASAVELSVAPDIEITLRSGDGAASAGDDPPVAAQARSPLAKEGVRSRRPSARAQDLERLAARLSAAESALERERERRAEVEGVLEDQRAETRRLSAEVGRARAELDLASTVKREGEAVAAELDSARRELRGLERRHQELMDEHHRLIDAHASLESELRERSGALESARDALEAEREKAAEAIEAERTRAKQTLEQQRTRHGDELEAERRARTEELEAERRARAQALEAERGRAAERARAAAQTRPASTELFAAVQDEDPDDEDAIVEHQAPRRRERIHEHDRGYEVRARGVGPQRVDRPVNPALRSRPNWVWRILAVLVFAAVVVAVYLVLHSTVLH